MRKAAVALMVAGIAVALALLLPAPAAADELDDLLRGPASVLMTSDELQIASELLDDAEREAFVEWFWQRRDPDPRTPANELRAEFLDRLAYVAKEFPSHGGVPAWATARGQLYLLLGPPHEAFRSSTRLAVDGAYRQPTIWRYRHAHDSVPTRFTFVDTRSGVRLVGHGASALGARQKNCIERHRTDLIRSDSRRLLETMAKGPEALPVSIETRGTRGTALTVVSIALDDLLGEATDHGIRYEFAFEDRGKGAARRLGDLQVEIDVDVYREWRDQRLHVALLAVDPGVDLALVESPTGRRAMLRDRGGHGEEFDSLPAGRVLAVSRIPGVGTVVAYFPTCVEHHPKAAAFVTLNAATRELSVRDAAAWVADGASDH